MKMTRSGISELKLSMPAKGRFLAVPVIIGGYFYKI
jgi:hypothetical protein